MAKLASLKEKYKDDEEKTQQIASHEIEIEMFRKYSDYYGISSMNFNIKYDQTYNIERPNTRPRV